MKKQIILSLSIIGAFALLFAVFPNIKAQTYGQTSNNQITFGDNMLAANQTITSNATLVPLNNSTITVAAGKTYAFTWDGQVNGTATAGLQLAFNGTSTATAFNVSVTSVSANATAGGLSSSGGNLTEGGNVGFTTQTTGLNIVHAVGYLTANAGGTFQPYVAQQASNATATTILAGAQFHWTTTN